MERKRCTKCGAVKPVTEFYTRKEGRSGLRSHCKVCKREYQRKYYQRRARVRNRYRRRKAGRAGNGGANIVLLMLLVCVGAWFGQHVLDVVDQQQQYIAQMEAELAGVSSELVLLRHDVATKAEQLVVLEGRLAVAESELAKVEWIKVEATGYAPLDPAAVAGMCHDGDPTSTATGTYPDASRTLAVDPKVIPYGSQVYIPGIGVRVAEDTGSMIRRLNKDGLPRIDIMFATRAEALRWGRQVVYVAVRGHK